MGSSETAGLAIVLPVGGRGTPGYAALELWMPFPNQEWFPRLVWKKFNKGELEQLLVEKNMEKAKVMSTIALWCVQYFPEVDHPWYNVVKNLEGAAEIATPPNPFQYLAYLSVELPSSSDNYWNS
ncbi:hypothetical protein PTKIN_Ptkin11bG0123700 [Pterospermum kingtungense]